MSAETLKKADKSTPGRPSSSEAKAVRQQLIQVSQQLFASHGYQGVSIKAIADHAGVNPAMVHYYFGNKDGLFVSVIEETIAPVLKKLQSLAPITDIESFINQFLRIYMTTIAANPWFPTLLVREVLLPEGRLRERFLSNIIKPVSNKILKLIEDRKQDGDLNDDIDPTLATINLISLAVFPFIAMPLLEESLKLKVDLDLVENLIRHTSRVYLSGIHTTGTNL